MVWLEIIEILWSSRPQAHEDVSRQVYDARLMIDRSLDEVAARVEKRRMIEDDATAEARCGHWR